MDYEKAYKEALEKIREGLQPLPDGAKISGVTRAFLEEVFPELGESEDEKIRKELIEHIKANEEVGFILFQKFSPTQIISWLERQKSVSEIVERCKNSWYNEGKIAGMAEGLTNDEKYQQGWHGAHEKRGEQKSSWCEDDERIVTALMEGFRYHQLFNPRFGEVPNAEIISWIKSLKERLS